MLAVPGRSGWWAPPESRPAAPTSPPGAAALQPPSSLQGSRTGQVAIGCAPPCSPGDQNSFHSGNGSILKFLPGSSKTATAWDEACYGHGLERTDGEMDRRAGEGGQHEGNAEGWGWRHGKVFLRSEKGEMPVFPHSCYSVSNLSLHTGVPRGRSLQTADLLRKSRKPQSRSQRRMSSALPEPGRREGKLDGWEIFQGKRWPGPSFRGQPRTQQRRVPEVHYPVTLCLLRRAGSRVISPEAL